MTSSDKSARHSRPGAHATRATAWRLGVLIALVPAAAAAAAAEDAGDSRALRAEPPSPRRLGLMFDLGTIEGGMLSLVYRPAPWLRAHGGVGSNGASPGFRLGVTFPHRSGAALALEAGHYFPGDLNGVFSAFAGSDYDDASIIEDFDYDFVNLQAGWEWETSNLMFFTRAGATFLRSQLPAEELSSVRNLSSLVDPDGSVDVVLPSLKLGFIGFF
jgi:hypothetical protein